MDNPEEYNAIYQRGDLSVCGIEPNLQAMELMAKCNKLSSQEQLQTGSTSIEKCAKTLM